MKAPGAHRIFQGFQDTATHSPCHLFLPIPQPHPSPAWLYIAFTVIKSVLQSKILQTAYWDQPLPSQAFYRGSYVKPPLSFLINPFHIFLFNILDFFDHLGQNVKETKFQFGTQWLVYGMLHNDWMNGQENMWPNHFKRKGKEIGKSPQSE